jgi:hypothetical protein
LLPVGVTGAADQAPVAEPPLVVIIVVIRRIAVGIVVDLAAGIIVIKRRGRAFIG